MQKKILAITVVIIMALAALGSALFVVMNDNYSDGLDGCIADISGAEYLAACTGQTKTPVVSAFVNSMSDYYVDGNNNCQLFKIDHNGKGSPVNFYKNSLGVKVQVNYDNNLVYLKKAGNLLYVMFTSDVSLFKNDPNKVSVLEQYVISLDNGKIYSVPDGNSVCVRNNECGITVVIPMFDYIGEYKEKPLFLKSKHGDNDNAESVCTMEVVNNKLVIEELFKVDRLGTFARIYKDDVIVMYQNSLGTIREDSVIVRLSDGNIYTGSFAICDGYVCKTVNYTNTYFPTSCERFNSDGTTTLIEYSAEESFRIASEEVSYSEWSDVLYRYGNEDESILVKLKGLSEYGFAPTMIKVTLKKDLSYTEENIYYNYVMTTGKTRYPMNYSVENKVLYSFIKEKNKSVNGTKEPTIIDGKMVYYFENGRIRLFNLETNVEDTIDVPELAVLSTINVVDGKIYATGVSSDGQTSHVKLNTDGTIVTNLSEMELRTFIMLPLY